MEVSSVLIPLTHFKEKKKKVPSGTVQLLKANLSTSGELTSESGPSKGATFIPPSQCYTRSPDKRCEWGKDRQSFRKENTNLWSAAHL